MSAVLTGLLIALALPPYLPWWIPVFASATAITLGKQIYGGLGNNISNPAMLGYFMVLIAWPLHLTAWPDSTTLVTNLDTALKYAGTHDGNILASAMSGATPLEIWRIGSHKLTDIAPIPWEMLNIAFALGGLWLLFKGIISWHIPVAFIVTLAVAIIIIHSDLDVLRLHLTSGSTMLGAFFIATDPATSPRNPLAMLIFGVVIGLLLALIRSWGNFADGLAFAVLTTNALVPLLDKLSPSHANK